MANDIAEEKTLVSDPCQDVCHLAYDLARSEGADHDTADRYADQVYANCVKSNKLETLKKK